MMYIFSYLVLAPKSMKFEELSPGDKKGSLCIDCKEKTSCLSTRKSRMLSFGMH